MNLFWYFQSEAIKVLERAAADSKVAMETADQSLSKREDFVTDLQSQVRDLEGTNQKDEFIPETPCKPSETTPSSTVLDKFRESISSLDFSFTKKTSEQTSSARTGTKTKRGGGSYHPDSSGVVADLDSEDTDSEISFKNHEKQCILAAEQSYLNKKAKMPVHVDQQSVDYTASGTTDVAASPVINRHQQASVSGFNFKKALQSTNENYFKFHKPLNDSRVLQVVLTPLKNKLVVKQTKSSMLRLKNSPVKDPTRGRECMKNSPLVRKSLNLEGKENIREQKRKCEEEDKDIDNDLNTSKRRKVDQKKKQTKTQPVTNNKRGQKYNLRTRR